MRQMFTEAMVLASAGGIIGLALGAAGVALVKSLATIEAQGIFRIVFGGNILPRAGEVAIDVRLFAIAFALTAITSLLCGLLPALHLSRTSHLQAMGSRGGGSTPRETCIRGALVVGQLALATALLVGAGLLASSFVNLTTVEKGYDPSKVLALQVALPGDYSTARKAEVVEDILGRLRAMPEVAAAGFAYAGILIGVEDTVGAFVPPGGATDGIMAAADRPRLKSVSAGYLDSVAVRLLDGRLLTDADISAARPVVVINRTVATRYFAHSRAVGRHLDWHHGSGAPVRVQIVGVIDDVRQGALSRDPYAEIFMDYRQLVAIQQARDVPPRVIDHLAFGFMSFALRTHGRPGEAIPAVRKVISDVDRNAGIDAIMPLEQLVGYSTAKQWFYAVILGLFAAVAGLLAAIGVYGVLAYAVVQRTQEIGIRIALGARPVRVLGLVLQRGLWISVIGIGIGLAGAAGVTRFLQTMLFGVTPLDAGVFGAVALGFTAVALLASYVPARRATHVDPAVALRTE